MAETHRIRLRILSAIFVLLGLLFLWRLFSIQVTHGAQYQEDGEKQYVATVPNIFSRGTIYFKDADGKLTSAATLKTGYIIAIEPKKIINRDDTYEKISAIIPLDKIKFYVSVNKKDDPYEEIAVHVDEAVKDKILALKIGGVSAYRERWRYYPNDHLASQVIGMMGYKDDTYSGRYGVERFYDDLLSRSGDGLYVNFFADMFLNLGNTLFHSKDEQKEGDIVLTIDSHIQEQLELNLHTALALWHADSVGGIIMDPQDGKVLAMAALPDFNPNDLTDLGSVRVLANPLVESDFEMGSTIKPLTMAAGIDVGAVTPSTTYNDTGSVTMDKKTFSNYDGRGRGPGTSMQEVLNQSLNTGVAFVEEKMGKGVFRQYFLEKYHLGDETGIDLPNETQGLMTNLDSRRDIEYATASFGQGIAMTPINVATALCSLGNGGKLPTPYIVDEIHFTDGTVQKTIPNPPEQILKPETSNTITRMLVTVVDKALVNGKAKMENYTIAAKTGTAQMARPRNEGGGYYDDRYMHTFFGYFPAYDPHYLIFLYIVYPKDVKYASQTLTTPFMDTTKFILNYKHVPPDRGPSVATDQTTR